MAGPERIGFGAIRIEQLRFGYDPATVVLHDLSLDIPAGGFYGLVGHTGSGKSTLLIAIAALLSGAVRTHHARWRRSCRASAMSTSVPMWVWYRKTRFCWPATVRDNIAMGRELSTRSDRDRCARRALP
ncbi:MAG: ATP-binding cassette domain-containing protein [Microthrixaceae bacterium]